MFWWGVWLCFCFWYLSVTHPFLLYITKKLMFINSFYIVKMSILQFWIAIKTYHSIIVRSVVAHFWQIPNPLMAAPAAEFRYLEQQSACIQWSCNRSIPGVIRGIHFPQRTSREHPGLTSCPQISNNALPFKDPPLLRAVLIWMRIIWSIGQKQLVGSDGKTAVQRLSLTRSN